MSTGPETRSGNRARVLFLAHRIPFPPDKGDKIRTYHEARSLASVADLTVACFIDDPADRRHRPDLERLCDNAVSVDLGHAAARVRSLVALAGGGPLSLAYYRSGAMRRALRALDAGGPFDAVLAFSSTMAPYARLVRAGRRVLDLCDLDSEKWAQYAKRSRFLMSFVYRTEATRLGRYEREIAREFDSVLLISEAEARALRGACPGADVRVVPNGVDLDALDPAPFGCDLDPGSAVFCGAMDYRANVDAVIWFHDEILPLVRRRVPDARLRIVGSNPAPAVRALAATPGVTVTGRVPDVRPELLRCAVSVAPLRMGRGVPNKVLEALALEMPVVTTPSAAAGLDLASFEGVDVVDGAEAFAEAVAARLEAAARGASRHPQHRRILRDRYSWEKIGSLLRGIVLDGKAGS